LDGAFAGWVITTVGHSVKLSDGGDRATLSLKAICASACAFSLLGGTRRPVPAQAYVKFAEGLRRTVADCGN
jgi:hypothetical protein